LKTPYAALNKAGVEFCLVKGDQGTATANHMQLARDAGMMTGEYFWHDPTISASVQAAAFLKCCETNKPDFVFLDDEQWWADWGKWRLWQYDHKIPQAQVPVTAPNKISDSTAAILETLSHGLDCQVGDYSAKWFIDGYAPGLAKILVNYPFWAMSIISETAHVATWAEITAGPFAGYRPNMPSKMTSWVLAQWSSGKTLPTIGDRIDLNLFDGDLAAFKSWAGLQPPPAPVLTLEQRVDLMWAEFAKTHPQ
jgi:GH25 family lysozyme M1 (1,4-beta-N-acetylmuramidase)